MTHRKPRRRRDSYCHIGYEVAPLNVKTYSGKMIRKVFSDRAEAKAFKRQHPGAVLRVVEVCDGKIVRRGKRQFAGQRR